MQFHGGEKNIYLISRVFLPGRFINYLAHTVENNVNKPVVKYTSNW